MIWQAPLYVHTFYRGLKTNTTTWHQLPETDAHEESDKEQAWIFKIGLFNKNNTVQILFFKLIIFQGKKDNVQNTVIINNSFAVS